MTAAHNSATSERIEHLERRNRQLAAMHAIAQTGGEIGLDELIPRLARIASDATESDMAAIYLAEGEANELFTLRGSHGVPDTLLGAFSRLGENSVTCQIARTRRPQAIAASKHPEALVQDSGLAFVAFVPIEFNGRFAGALDLGRIDHRPYTDDELDSIAIVADQIAVVIERTRLYAETQLRLKQLTLLFELARLGTEASEVQPLVDHVLELALEALGLDGVMIHLLQHGSLVLAGHRSRHQLPREATDPLQVIPIDEASLSGRAALNRSTIIVSGDPWPARSHVARRAGTIRTGAAAPLIAKDQLVGTICVLRAVDRAFTRDEVRLIESCAAHIASAIEHANLFEAERRRAQELAMINDLGRLISEQLDLEAVLDAGVRQLALIADVPQAFLLLFVPGKRALRMVASNIDAVFDITVTADEPSIVMRAVRERRPVMVNETGNGPESEFHRGRVDRLGQLAILSVPLISRGEAIGAVVLGHTQPGRVFDNADVERAVAVSNQLATAISNAKLFEDLRASYHELERAQERLVQRERLAAIGEMAASVAHEVRNPLGVIFNSLASLRRLLPPSPDAQMLLGIAGEEAERLNRIVGDLLDFARPSEPRVESQSVELVVIGAAEAATNAEGVPSERIAVTMESPIPRLVIDPQLFRQALINLMVNALQVSPASEPVRVHASIERSNGRSYVRIDVQDAGPGIEPSLAAKIFEPFFTTKAKGTGLGLSIVKRIVTAHHGRIDFDSTQGQGTTFTVRFPLDAAES